MGGGELIVDAALPNSPSAGEQKAEGMGVVILVVPDDLEGEAMLLVPEADEAVGLVALFLGGLAGVLALLALVARGVAEPVGPHSTLGASPEGVGQLGQVTETG